MSDEQRLHEIIYLLRQYSARPPLKFPTEAEIPKLARRILETAKGPKSLWTKWSSDREDVIKRAADVWIPLDDLREALNVLPGENLTATDVEQRLNAVRSELGGYTRGPDETLKEEAFTAYATEKAKGTEFIALLGWMEDWMWGAEEILRRKQTEERQRRIAQERRQAEARLRSGADSPWTGASGFPDLYCRKNARLFRLKGLNKDTSPLAAKFEVFEVKSFEDKRGVLIGRYRTRSDASKAVLEVAYNPEWS
ncbi:hypothetical protein [Novacetimonas hansenii]|uniref:hypothetical protein n=1 Tax=Novacetimonas hansenii TaxID=436 RepID=UPI00094FC227|nr:hypothetical protein [Novacetimonas hansenii]